MTQIILSEEQSRIVRTAEGPVVLLDSETRPLGTVIPLKNGEAPVLSRELTDELVRRMSQEDIQWRTTAQVLDRLKSLGQASAGVGPA